MKLEDSIVVGLFVLAFPALLFLLRKRQKQGTKVIEAVFEIDASAPTEIDARLSVEFQQRTLRSDRLWLICLVGISIALIVVVYVSQFEKRHAIAVLTTLIASCAFINLRKRFAQNREEAKKVSLSLCPQWLTYRYSSGENRMKIEAIERVSFSSSPYSNLTVTRADGQTAQFIGFDNAEKIYVSIRNAIEHRKR